MASNLTLDELKTMMGGPELNNPLLRHIVSISKKYLDTYQNNFRLGRLPPSLLREILLGWVEFFNKYGNNRDDMNSIVERGIANNYNLNSNSLTRQAWGIHGQRDNEILAWNREHRDELMEILEIESQGALRLPSHNPKKKRRKSKRKSKKRKSKRKSKKR
jgi:hypothetical protein